MFINALLRVRHTQFVNKLHLVDLINRWCIGYIYNANFRTRFNEYEDFHSVINWWKSGDWKRVCVYELNGILWFITSITSMFVFIGHGQWCFNAITNRLSLLVFCLFVLFSFKMEKREEKTESTPSIQNGENSNAKCTPLTDHIKYSKIAFSVLQMNKHVMQRVDVHQKTVR